MNQFLNDIKKCMTAYGNTTDIPNARQTGLYIGCLYEETMEVNDEVFPEFKPVGSMGELSANFKKGMFNGQIICADKEKLLKELMDTAWVAIAAAVSMGADVDGAMQELARSNLSKIVDGKVVKDGNGKVIKPESYSPANMEPFIYQI